MFGLKLQMHRANFQTKPKAERSICCSRSRLAERHILATESWDRIVFADASAPSLSMRVAPQQASCLLFLGSDVWPLGLGNTSDVWWDHVKLGCQAAYESGESKEGPGSSATYSGHRRGHAWFVLERRSSLLHDNDNAVISSMFWRDLPTLPWIWAHFLLFSV